MKGCLTIIVSLAIIGIFMAIFGSHKEEPSIQTPTPVTSKPAPAPIATPQKPVATPSPIAEPFPKEGCWPDKVHLQAPVQVSGVVGSGSMTMTEPVGEEVFAFLSSDHKTVTIQVDQLKGTAPIESTDFVALATARELAEFQAAENEQKKAVAELEKQKAAAAGAEAEYGEKPEFYDAGFTKKIPPLVEAFVKRSMGDPDSFTGVEIGGMQKAECKGQKCYEIQFTYSGKNAYNATRVGIITAWVKNGVPLDLKILER